MNDQKPTDQDDELDAELEVEVVTGEAVDGLPALSETRYLERRAPVLAPVQAAAVAATGFLAGAATLALLNRRGGRRLSQEVSDLRELRDRYEAARRGAPPLGMTPGKTYLVQIRVLGRPPE